MTYAIVPATEALAAAIEVWLDAEEAAFKTAESTWPDAATDDDLPPTRGFRCNWDTVKAGWRNGRTPLDVLTEGGVPVGFLFGFDIVEIHPDHRRRGLGALLSDFMLRRAGDEGLCVLEIEIAPRTAKPFWLRQGFELLDDGLHPGNGQYAYRVIARAFPLGSGPRVPVEIGFYEERAAYAGGGPFTTFAGEGERLPEGSIQLPERVFGYSPLVRWSTNDHVRITVGGDEVYFGRAKYGQAHGMRRDPEGTHYIERVLFG